MLGPAMAMWQSEAKIEAEVMKMQQNMCKRTPNGTHLAVALSPPINRMRDKEVKNKEAKRSRSQ
jgi:hypothetical protein